MPNYAKQGVPDACFKIPSENPGTVLAASFSKFVRRWHKNAAFAEHCPCILHGIQLEVGHDLIDHVYCMNTSMPEHEAVPLSHKMC